MKIAKTINYTEKDLINFGFSSYFYKRGKFLIIMCCIFFLAIAALFAINGKLGETELFMILLYILILAVTPIIIYFQMRKSYRTSKVFQQEQYFEISDEGIYGKSNTGEGKIAWDMFHEFILYRKTIAFYASSRQAYIFPTRIFTNDEINQIKNLLISNNTTKDKTKVKLKK